MRIIASGDRNGYSPYRVAGVMKGLYTGYEELTVVEGCAPGLDSQIEDWCHSMGAIEVQGRTEPRVTGRLVLEHWPALWAVHEGCYCGPDKARCNFAGHRRNLEMLKSGDIEAVVTFHEYIANSKGTRNMAEIAQEADIKVLFIGSTL